MGITFSINQLMQSKGSIIIQNYMSPSLTSHFLFTSPQDLAVTHRDRQRETEKWGDGKQKVVGNAKARKERNEAGS